MNEQPTIESGVPLPGPFANGYGKNYRLLLSSMKPGDSVFYAGIPSKVLANRMYRAMAQVRPRRFIVRNVEGGSRVWRVEDRPC